MFIINLGLHVNGSQPKTQLKASINALAPFCLQYQQVAQSQSEPTLVAVVRNQPSIDQLETIATKLQQEAIAVSFDGMGAIIYSPVYGVDKDWGDFNPSFFLMPETKTGAISINL